MASRLAGSLTDITEAKLADALTGLPNRLLFIDLVERAIKRTERRAEYEFAILALSLDRFRIVHDSLGPLAADRLLVAVARRLQSSLRATDVVTRDEPGFTLARLGGDEFKSCSTTFTDAGDAVLVAERLRAVARSAVRRRRPPGLRVGARRHRGQRHRLHPRRRHPARRGDRAQSRDRVGDTPTKFSIRRMRQRAMTRLQFETDLRNAIDDRAFEMHYQPIVSLRSGRIAGFEALLRWRHPVRGLVPPADFIAVAEDTGMIIDIGRLTLDESCRQMATWLSDFGAAAPQLMCANVSSKQLADAGLDERDRGDAARPPACWPRT